MGDAHSCIMPFQGGLMRGGESQNQAIQVVNRAFARGNASSYMSPYREGMNAAMQPDYRMRMMGVKSDRTFIFSVRLLL